MVEWKAAWTDIVMGEKVADWMVEQMADLVSNWVELTVALLVGKLVA